VCTPLCSRTIRHKQLTEQALAALGARKDQECVQALAALREELRGEIDAAYKERDEHLENYSKVSLLLIF
jgi:predicted negative regulator of RcsB-dependent stress response